MANYKNKQYLIAIGVIVVAVLVAFILKPRFDNSPEARLKRGDPSCSHQGPNGLPLPAC